MSKPRAKKGSTRRWVEHNTRDAGDFFGHALEVAQPGDKVILVARVSNRERKRDLPDHVANLRDKATEYGLVVADVETHVGSGFYPAWLVRAEDKREKHGAKFLFAESTDRLIRHPGYHSSDNPEAQARCTHLEELEWWTQGRPVITDLPPNATPSEVRSYQTERGRKAKGNKGGRPRTLKPKGKERMLAYIDRVMEMHEAGMSYRKITDELNGIDDNFPKVCHATVGNWIRAEKRRRLAV